MEEIGHLLKYTMLCTFCF